MYAQPCVLLRVACERILERLRRNAKLVADGVYHVSAVLFVPDWSMG